MKRQMVLKNKNKYYLVLLLVFVIFMLGYFVFSDKICYLVRKTLHIGCCGGICVESNCSQSFDCDCTGKKVGELCDCWYIPAGKEGPLDYSERLPIQCTSPNNR